MWCDDPADLYRLTIFAQNDIDPPEGKADAAYLFGHTEDFQEPILWAGIQLSVKGKTKNLCFCKLAPGYPYALDASGKCLYRDEQWLERLTSVTKNVIPIESPKPNSPNEKFPVSHTGTEAENLVMLAKEEGWESIYIVAHPIHVLRAFTLTITFARRLYPKLRVYAKAGYPPQPWTQGTVSNQGVITGTRLEVVDGEWDRLNKVYGNKYDPASALEVLEYVKQRDPLLCEHLNCPFPYDANHIHCDKCGEAFTNDPDAINQHPRCPAIASA